MLRFHCLLAMVLFACCTSFVRGQDGLIITRGGVYSGDYSTIRIDTSEPVTIENATLGGEGALITSHYHHANVTIRNVRASGADDAHHAGRFVSLEGFDNVVIENCLLERTEGIYLLDYAGNRTSGQTVKILRNIAREIDGRKADGKGGYGGDANLVQFVQLDKVRHVPQMEIAWNQVINTPGRSRVEDNINIYLSSGTAESPLKIHDNFIQGAYPPDPARQGYSGGGILLGDGVSHDGVEGDAGFVQAFDNQVLDTSNYGIAIAAGHDNQIYANRIVSTGVLADGAAIAAQNVGVYIWDSYHAGKAHFFNNSGHDNLIGWSKGAGRNDWWTPDAGKWEGNTHWAAPIPSDVYQSEWNRWQTKLSKQRVGIGVITSAATRG
jgi:hypothetical protein